MNRTDVTYGQLNRVLRSLGFSCRLVEKEPPTRLYEHKATGAYFTIPPFPDDDCVLEHHLFKVRVMLEYSGIADPKIFEAELRKAG